MQEYILVSEVFTGYITFGFDGQGYLVHYQMCIHKASKPVIEGMLKHLQYCLTRDQFIMWCRGGQRTFIAVGTDLSFERFWREYGHAINKARALKKWNGFKDHEKVYILHNLAAYKRYCERNSTWYNILCPDSYLEGRWMDEWDKIITKAQAHDKDNLSR